MWYIGAFVLFCCLIWQKSFTFMFITLFLVILSPCLSFIWWTGCSRNISHILNCHLCGASRLRQVAMVAPFHLCLCFFFCFFFPSPLPDMHHVCSWSIFFFFISFFYKPDESIITSESFSCYVKINLQRKFSNYCFSFFFFFFLLNL